MSDNNETPEVVVEVTPAETPEVEPVDEGDNVVIVEDGGSDELDAVEVETAINHEGRISTLEALTEQQSVKLAELGWKYEDGEWRMDAVSDRLTELETADEEIVEQVNENFDAIDDAEVVDTDDDGDVEVDADIKPVTAKKHFLFRSLDEWRGK